MLGLLRISSKLVIRRLLKLTVFIDLSLNFHQLLIAFLGLFLFVSNNNIPAGTYKRHFRHLKRIRMSNSYMDVHEAEDRDGIRFTFNTWPGTRVEATKCVIPMGCMYNV